MKTLQDNQEKIWELTGKWQLKTVERKPQHSASITLLLHGLDERGLRIYRKLVNFLPADSYVVAPNAPFPLPRKKSDRIDFGYAWYFYDRFNDSFPVDQSLAVSLLKELLLQINPQGLPVYIIGFSQGGYLAPMIAYELKEARGIIGIGCEFRTRYFQKDPHFWISAVHGDQDPIIDYRHAQRELENLSHQGIKVDWYPLPGVKHEITPEVGLTIKTILETSDGNRSL